MPAEHERHGGKRRWGEILLFLAIVLALAVGGVVARGVLWHATADIRYQFDIRNGMNWGGWVLQHAHERAGVDWDRPGELSMLDFLRGYHGFYAYLDAYKRETGETASLDYGPARLLIVANWMRIAREGEPSVASGADYHDDLAWPMLRFNLFMEAAAALLLAGFVGHWLIRCGRSRRLSMWLGVTAGGLLWLNPALMLDTHAWPQWDAWLLPFYIVTIWLAATGRAWGWWAWGLAGVAVGMGAMLKGQILLAAPALVVWAVLQRDGRGVAAFAGGILLAWATVGSAWLLNAWLALSLAGAFVAILTAGLILITRRWNTVKASDAALVGLSLVGPLIFLAGWLGGGDFAWLQAGLGAAPGRDPQLAIFPASNLPAILETAYGLGRQTPVPFGPLGSMTLGTLLTVIATIGGLLAGWMLFHQHRRRDPRLLVATGGVWITLFALLPQMHERYLVWAAALSAAWAVTSLAGLLLHLGITAAACVMMLHGLTAAEPEGAPRLLDLLDPTHPWLGLAVAILAVASLVVAVGPAALERKATAPE